MGINPAMGMGYGFGGDDFYTQMLYQQMANGGAANSSIWNNAGVNNSTAGGWGASSAGQQTVKQGPSIGKALMYGAGAGAAVGAGTYFTNNPFTAAVKDGKFTDDFLAKFSGEYAALQNGDKAEKFFKGLGTTKTPITVENYGATMNSIEEFIKSGDVDDLSAEAKQMLKKKFGLAKVDKTTLKGLHSTDLAEMKKFFTDTVFDAKDLASANSLNAKQAMLDSLDDIRKGWKDLGTGKDSIPAKLEYLREHGHTMGMDKADYQKLLCNADDIKKVEDLDDIFKKFSNPSLKKSNPFKARKTALTGEVNTIKKAMQKFATKWDKNAGWFGKGFSKAGNKKTMEALENALSAMKKGKAGKYGAIAAAGAAVLSLFV
ncbi:MAG: hypothetical protein NC390_07890 [Fusobacterium sp.]|nr:hypothetical protein [Fusobacterium sp.]